jgi:hypothetical protein
VKHVRLLVIVGRKNHVVDDMLQCLSVSSDLFSIIAWEKTHRLALVVFIFLDCWGLPDFVVVLRGVEVRAVVQCMLNHEVVILEFQVLDVVRAEYRLIERQVVTNLVLLVFQELFVHLAPANPGLDPFCLATACRALFFLFFLRILLPRNSNEQTHLL